MRVAVLTCMDSRIDLAWVLGLQPGEANIIRNAGGVATDDAVRSLVVSQRLLGTEEIVVIHHTDCGQESYSDDEMKAKLEAETGFRPSFAFENFPDARADVRQTINRLKASPFLQHKHRIRGYMYEVETGRLREIL